MVVARDIGDDGVEGCSVVGKNARCGKCLKLARSEWVWEERAALVRERRP